MSESSVRDKSLARTPLHALHLELGGKMVAFAGYEMPVQYPAGIMKEHNHTRTAAGLFDVSHMGQVRLVGNDAAAALESLVPVDVIDLGIDHQRYALFTNDAGGILDDLMITNAGDHLFVVVNAACKQQDTARMRQYLGNRCRVEELTDRALLALQGPKAAAVMSRLAPETAKMLFMTAARVEIEAPSASSRDPATPARTAMRFRCPRSGGRAGSRPPGAGRSEADWARRARPRVSRRACASTHDIDTTTSPIEASLTWALSKVRRPGGARPGGYPGADVIARQLAEGVSRKGSASGPTARRRCGGCRADRRRWRDDRQNYERLLRPHGWRAGRVGYVETTLAKPGTELQAVVRGKPQPGQGRNAVRRAALLPRMRKEGRGMSVMRYTEDHEWLRVDDGDIATVGITDHAQSQLGDLVMVELPAVGKDVVKGGSRRRRIGKGGERSQGPGKRKHRRQRGAGQRAGQGQRGPHRRGLVFQDQDVQSRRAGDPHGRGQPITGLSKIDPRLVEPIGRELAKVQGGIYRCPASGSRWKFWSKEKASPAGISGQARPTNRQ